MTIATKASSNKRTTAASRPVLFTAAGADQDLALAPELGEGRPNILPTAIVFHDIGVYAMQGNRPTTPWACNYPVTGVMSLLPCNGVRKMLAATTVGLRFTCLYHDE